MFTKVKFSILCSKPNFSRVQLKEILDAHENTLMKFFHRTENAVLMKKMADLKFSTQCHTDAIDKKFLEVDKVYVVNDENIKTLADNHKNQHVKIRDLEDKSRRNSLRFDGLSSQAEELA